MLSQDEYSTILIDKRADGVTIATLNRPEKLNAVNSAMHHELSRISVDATHDPDVKCLVLTGRAGRSALVATSAPTVQLGDTTYWTRRAASSTTCSTARSRSLRQ